ncbi:MAG: hypothetical protein NTZ71_11315 [Planctomycetota bacterium]|nr:hypothetical protein [Planctomycetota bacterium]
MAIYTKGNQSSCSWDQENRIGFRIEAIELDVFELDKSKWVFDPAAWSIAEDGFVTIVYPDSQGFISHVNIKSNKLFNWKLMPDSDWADYSSSVDPVSKNADKERHKLWNDEGNSNSKSRMPFVLNVILRACLLPLFIFSCFSIYSMSSNMLKSEKDKKQFDKQIGEKNSRIKELDEKIDNDAREYARYFGFDRPEQFKKKYDALSIENNKLKGDIKKNLPLDAKASIDEANKEKDKANAQVDEAIIILRKTANDMESKRNGKFIK